jgi:hypothetical protein
MSPIAEKLAGAVHQNAPRVVCFACLANQQQLKEHVARAVALVVMVRTGLRLVRRRCSSCLRVDDALMAQQVA